MPRSEACKRSPWAHYASGRCSPSHCRPARAARHRRWPSSSRPSRRGLRRCRRLAAVSKRTYVDLLRERFGYRFFLLPLVAVFLVSFLVLASEIGGVSIALQMATGINFAWWAIPVALLGWVLLWRGTFGIVEKGTALRGLAALVFAVGALKLHPAWPAVGLGIVPPRTADNRARYRWLAVRVLRPSSRT